MSMTRRIALCLLPFGSAAVARAQRKRKERADKLDITALTVRRVPEERAIAIEGRIRNSGTRPVRNLTLVFHLLAPGGEEVSRPRGKVEEESLDPGAEAEFTWNVHDQARAVELRLTAVAAGETEIDVDKPGPYPID